MRVVTTADIEGPNHGAARISSNGSQSATGTGYHHFTAANPPQFQVRRIGISGYLGGRPTARSGGRKGPFQGAGTVPIRNGRIVNFIPATGLIATGNPV